MDLDLNQFMGMFVDGSRENLDVMDKTLLALEQNPQDREAIEQIFRAAHTLKGMGATMGFDRIVQVTHVMESVLDKLRNRELAVNSHIIDVILETIDVLRVIVNDSISGSETEVDTRSLLYRLENIHIAEAEVPQSTPGTPKQAQQSAKATPQDESLISKAEVLRLFNLSEYEVAGIVQALQANVEACIVSVRLVVDCLLKGPRVFMVMRTLEGLQCDAMKAVPDFKDLENENFDKTFHLIVSCPGKASDLQSNLETIAEVDKVQVLSLKPEDFSTQPQTAPQQQTRSSAPQPQQPQHQPQQPPAPPPRRRPTAPPPVQPPPPAYQDEEAEYPRQPQRQYSQQPAPPPSYQQPQNQQYPYQQPQNQSYPYQQQPQNPQYPYQQPQQNLSYPYSNQPQQAPGNQGAFFNPGSNSLFQTSGAGSSDFGDLKAQEEDDSAREANEIVQVVSFSMGNETYALDIALVEGIINLSPITRVPKAPSYIEGVINMRGEIVPVLNLRKRLKLNSRERAPKDQIVILHFEKEKVKVGLLVDSVHEVIRLPNSAIEPPAHISAEGIDVEYLDGVGKVDALLIILLNASKIVFGAT